MSNFGLIASAKLKSPLPIYAPTYGRSSTTKSRPGFSDINCITIKYRTDATHIKELLPDNLSVEESPIVTVMFLEYGFSSIGPYKELIHYVEVIFNGEKYDYPILLVLDNEDAVYGGREVWGYPKVLGTCDFNFTSDGQSGFMAGSVQRPKKTPIIEFLFKPTGMLDTNTTAQSTNPGLNLRIIPSPVPGAQPSVRQFLEVDFRLVGGETWEGVGSLNFPVASEFDPLHKFPVVEYLSASFIRKCTGILKPPSAVHDF